ncbi:CpaF family protein [Fodinicurvata fenggangensis]|uniref:CpaF family protein n=1 Tax=Fodinicurvata fenggangensis TaxID=1121830 RepID=UPI0009DF6F37|nr:CpaF family protein [Fodinicurvata fenggangensis]
MFGRRRQDDRPQKFTEGLSDLRGEEAPAVPVEPESPPPEAEPRPSEGPAAVSPDSVKTPRAAVVIEEEPSEGRHSGRLKSVRQTIGKKVYQIIDFDAAVHLDREALAREIGKMVADITMEDGYRLTAAEQKEVADALVDDMVGLGPLEDLLEDETVTDIMVNGPSQVYVERNGKLVLTPITFRDDAHATAIAQRIAYNIGRRVDEASPMVDARLMDGSRVNIILPPLAIDGCSISIRKFAKRKITLDDMIRQDNISEKLGRLLQVAAACRLNIIVSGGTGSGKTTLLNALSRLIDPQERIVTIEDAAEIQLQQPHVVRLETRPPNVEGRGEITMRSLLKNSLRMRPDRIIVGEVRGEETLDMLQAMNTGHDGSMSTIHANTPRDALTRIENMVMSSSVQLPSKAIRAQISSAVDLIVQIERMRDGKRRVTNVSELIGMEGDIITLQELFRFQYEGEARDGQLMGRFVSSEVRPRFIEQAGYYGLEDAVLWSMT